MIVVLTVLILGALALAATGVVAYFNSGARRDKQLRRDAEREAAEERERAQIALRALRQIAAGAELPIFVADDALASVDKTYRKELP